MQQHSKPPADAVREVLERGQLPLTLGGEHSLSAPSIAAVREYFPDLTVVHIDAHGDLRDEYEGTPLSHASIERRVVDMGIPLTEIGIRSFSPEEAEFMKTRPNVAIVWGYQLAKGNGSYSLGTPEQTYLCHNRSRCPRSQRNARRWHTRTRRIALVPIAGTLPRNLPPHNDCRHGRS